MFVRRLFASVVLMLSCAVAVGQVAGQNINMVSGTNWPAGDPFLQRQNEPSMAVSSRNPEHLLGGANDYRTVDIPNPAAPTILGDAWLGVYSSMDGGETWKSTLLPGYPQDTSAVGTASPLHKTYTVATDPTVRPGTHGLFYYSGLVFNRGTNTASAVFVATFQDQNNKGNGDNALLVTDNTGTHGNPFVYVNASLVHTANTRQFLDKPWIAVDIPRPGRTATCKVNGQTFQSGYVYVFYTVFTNSGLPTQHSSIMEVRSTNCGASWSAPLKLNDDTRQNQGASAVIDPQTGAVFVTWRALAYKTMPDSIQYAWSPDGWNWGNGISDGLVYTFPTATTTAGAFDQNQSGNAFRTTDIPTVAIDGSSKIWVAFTKRVPGPGGTSGSRIVLTTQSIPMWTWSTPYVADTTSWANGAATVPGFQFMPSLTFAYGKLSLAWFDSRRDNLESVLTCPTGNTCTGLSQLTKIDQAIPGSTIATPATVFTPSITDPNSGVRHTLDVFGGLIDPSAAKTFSGFQISQYAYWVDPATNSQIEQGFFNPPNLPIFVQGTTPFIGDYLDTAAQTIMPSGSSWVFNTKGKDSVTGATLAPDFHITWTDNRDVVPPPVVNGNQDWTQYLPPNSGTQQASTYFGTGTACPTCAPMQPACSVVTGDDGTQSAYSGDRNQNIYTSRISNGLIVRFKENAKPLSTAVPKRSFSLLVKNTVSPLNTNPLGSASYYRILLGATSTSQTPTCTVTGGSATFPSTPNCYLDVAINPTTTLTQAINLTSTTATASVNVLVAQIQSIPAGTTAPTFTGLQALAIINSDPSNPAVANPDFLVPDNSNPDIATPYGTLPIAVGESFDPTVDGPPDPLTGIFTPKIGVPAIFTPKIGSVANNSPAIQTPTVFTPKIGGVQSSSVQIVNPTIVDTIFTPKIFTPKIFTPKIVSPDIFTPKITDLSDNAGATNSITDYTWRVTNKGNTSASYATQEFPKSAGVSCCPASCSANPNSCTVTASNPAGPNCSVCQLVQQKVYESPVANQNSSGNPTCDLNVQQQAITVANISDPAFATGTGTGSPSDPTNSTLSLSPGEGNRVTLRVVAPPVSQTVSSFKTVATAFTADKGQTAPAASLTIATSALPVAVVGQNYTGTTLLSVGGFGATAWSVPPDPSNPVPATLPISPAPLPVTPLTLNQSGQISTSVVTALPGTYAVNMQVQDAAVTPSLDVQQIPLQVNQFMISNVNVAIIDEIGSTSYMKAGDMAMVSVTVSSTGPATASSVVPTLTVNALASGTPSGPTPSVTCSAPVPTSAIIMGTGTQMFNFTCTAASGNGYVTFTAHATGQYNNAAANVLATATPVSQPALTPSGIPPNVIVDTVAPTLAFGTTTSTQSAPGWYNAPVVISFTTSDNLSGVMSASATPPATSTGLNSGVLTLTTEGKLVTGTITVTDYARNTAAPFTSAGFNIDETKPTISGMANPPANGAGWNNTPVTVTFTCNDPNPLSGPGQQSGLVAGVAGCTAPVTLSSAGANQRASGTANDVAGNSASTTVTPINIDLIPPVVVLASPVDGHAYINNQPIPANYACSDDLSGVASCLAPVAEGNSFTQTAPGAYSFTVTSSDVAGNASFARNGYSSVYYNFAGFQSPLAGAAGPGTPATPPSAPTNSGSFVAGATIPILWTLAYPSGTLTPGPVIDPSTLVGLSVAQYANPNCSGNLQTAAQLAPAQSPNTYGYDSINQRFAFNWNTTSVTPGCYYLLIAFNDLSSHATNVTITSAGASNALNFVSGNTVDGTNSNLPGSNPQTMEAWINPSSAASGTVFSYVDPANANQGFGLAYFGQHVYLIGESNDVIGSITVPINQWAHVAVSFDGTNATLYVNGGLDKGTSQTATGVSLTAGGGTWRIGDIVGTAAPGQPFVGMIDEVKVWNTARTASQIVSDMTNELCTGVHQTGLVAYYKFNSGAAGGSNPGATTLFDFSSSQANGTLNNFALTGNTSNWVQGDAPVTADQLSSIVVSPAGFIFPGDTGSQQFTATGTCTDGSTPTLAASWSAGGGFIVTVDSTGLVTASSPGDTTVSATFADTTGSTIVSVP